MNNSRVMWLTPDDPPERFPPVQNALHEPDGLLAAGGDLSTARLLYAYRHGIFPWYDDGQPLLWWSPDPRCVFLRGDFHISRRLQRELKKSSAEIRLNTAFSDVIAACAEPRKSQQGTWITAAIRESFQDLHAQGWAHSIEIWQSSELIGGLYGLMIGKSFFGESMFSVQPNASKIALLYLASQLESGRIEMLDCQVISGHLTRLGARLIPRSEFVTRLSGACEPAEPAKNWPQEPILCSHLLPE